MTFCVTVMKGNNNSNLEIKLKLSNKEDSGSKEAEDLDRVTLMVGGGEDFSKNKILSVMSNLVCLVLLLFILFFINVFSIYVL